MSTLLGQLLVWNKIITEEQLTEALKYQKNSGENLKLGSILVNKGYVSESTLYKFLSKQYGVELVDLYSMDIPKEVINKIPAQVALKHNIVPVSIESGKIKVATSDPSNIFALDDVRFATGLKVIPVLATEDAIKDAISKYYGSSSDKLDSILKDISTTTDVSLVNDTEQETDISDLKSQSSKEPIVNLANLIISNAVEDKASDIHIEPYENNLRVRYRLDGELQTVMNLNKSVSPALVSRLKIISKLDISEKRLAQDGNIRLNIDNKSIDFRVSTLPTIFGEKVVLRILDKSNVMVNLEELGFEQYDLERYMHALQSPYGMILVSGPTGSGKTTTLYASLNKINKEDVNIMTVEDPVEYNLNGINQVMVKEDIGLTFANVLRAFLRQDPDIIMVGEIRDSETAEIAIRSALTGHLVLSTIHTNDAPSTIMRLEDMGIEKYLIVSSVILILAQRLVRKICPYCKEKVDIPPNALEELGFSSEDAKNVTIYKGRGCSRCNNTGYKGRVAIYEIIPISDQIRNMILKGASLSEIREQAIKEGTSTLRNSGLKKIKEGITTIEEVMNATFF